MENRLRFWLRKAFAGINQDPVTRSGYFPDEGSVNDWKLRTSNKPRILSRVRRVKNDK